MVTRNVRGVSVPSFMYGTAWKEAQTAPLTSLALGAGFRAIDTANQRRHYFEAAVGEAVAAATSAGAVRRNALFLQTKFTYQSGQDHRLPYDPAANPETQVQQSFDSSLEHLRTSYLDAYLLHGPAARRGLTASDWAVWRAMEGLARAKRTLLIGVSNVSLEQLEALERAATIKPAFVQNRCYASRGWDRDVRAFCGTRDIVYQGFSLLTANREVLAATAVDRIAQRRGRSPAQLVFRFALQVGMLPLTGTSSAEHMRADLDCESFELDPAELAVIERAGG